MILIYCILLPARAFITAPTGLNIAEYWIATPLRDQPF